MGVKKFHGNRLKKALAKIPIKVFLAKEEKLIESKYDFLSCTTLNGKLVCVGGFRPTPQSIEYKFIVSYNGKSAPNVHVRQKLNLITIFISTLRMEVFVCIILEKIA